MFQPTAMTATIISTINCTSSPLLLLLLLLTLARLLCYYDFYYRRYFDCCFDYYYDYYYYYVNGNTPLFIVYHILKDVVLGLSLLLSPSPLVVSPWSFLALGPTTANCKLYRKDVILGTCILSPASWQMSFSRRRLQL